VKRLLILVGLLAAGNAVAAPAPRPADAALRAGLRDEDAKHGNVRPGREKLMVTWTIHHGYRLWVEDDRSTDIIPEFPDEAVEAQFNTAFSQDNLARQIGKRIYCDCAGERFEQFGRPFFTVREARLFAQ